MDKNFFKKIVTTFIATMTIGSFSSLGVSAATVDSNINNYYKSVNLNVNNYYNAIGNKALNMGWTMLNGKWYFFDNSGAMQKGVIKVNGKTYLLNQSGIMEMGKVIVNNRTYTTNSNGQVIGSKAPVVDKVFDSNNNIVKDNNKTSTVTTSKNTQTTTPKTESTTNVKETVTSTKDTANNIKETTNTTKDTTTDTINTNNGTSTNTVENNNTTNTTSTNINTVDVQGLPKLPTKYPITVQPSVEQKILELMNAKRVEAGLNPLTMNNTLVQVARYKSNHLIQYNYFDHVNPDGTKWTNWLQTIGYKYTTTGENIAYNTYDAVELFTQWWNSPGHRANMMNSSYNRVGIGVVHGNGKYMGTQTFSN